MEGSCCIVSALQPYAAKHPQNTLNQQILITLQFLGARERRSDSVVSGLQSLMRLQSFQVSAKAAGPASKLTHMVAGRRLSFSLAGGQRTLLLAT